MTRADEMDALKRLDELTSQIIKSLSEWVLVSAAVREALSHPTVEAPSQALVAEPDLPTKTETKTEIEIPARPQDMHITSRRVGDGHYRTEEGYEIHRKNGGSWIFTSPDGTNSEHFGTKKAAIEGIKRDLSERLTAAA
jgi:hypothetical protein